MISLNPQAVIGERMGWVLVHTSWQFLLVAVVALALTRVLRHGPAAARYGMLLGAMAAMTLLPVVTWMVLPGGSLVPGVESAATPRHAIAPAHPSPEQTTHHASGAEAVGSASPPGPRSVSLPHRATTSPSVATACWSWIHDRVRPWLGELVAAWCVGVSVFSLRPIWSWLTIRRLGRVGVRAVPPSVQMLLRRAAERLRMRHGVQVLQSTLVSTPLVIGGLRPLILLPASVVTGIPASGLEAILVHELAHLRRHDFLVNLLQTIVETIFFYHPAVWWLSHQIRCERENCCDDAAVAALGSRAEYGRALLALEEYRGGAPALALGAGGGSLLARIRRLHARTPRLSAGATAMASALAASTVLIVGIGVWSMATANGRGGALLASDSAVMSTEEQETWNALEQTGVTIYGPGSHRQHLRKHLATLERNKFPERQREEIREQLAKPVESADFWQVPAEAWPLIARLESLRELNVVASDIDGEAFAQIARLPKLRRLSIAGSKALPQDATPLKEAKTLEEIDIVFSIFEEPAERRQEWLGELTEAERAWVDEYQARAAGRKHIVEAAILTDRLLDQLRELPNLKVLRLINTSVSGRGVEAVSVHTGLEKMDLNLVDFTSPAADAIGSLALLRSFRYADVSDETLASFARLKRLEELELWAEGVTDAGIRHLLPLRSLRRLALRGSAITDAGLLELATLPNLERLDLQYAKGNLTPEGLAEFQRLRPECQLITDGTKEQAPKTSAVSGEERLQLWKLRLVDGENDQPLPGITVRAPRLGGAEAIALTSDANGLLEMPVRRGKANAVMLKIEERGWFTNQWVPVGNEDPSANTPSEASAERDPEQVQTLKLWRGTTVSGRLLLPDGHPAGGVRLNVGVYINSQQWKERLGMHLGWNSWDHGQWPNLTTGVITDDEGSFETTVPPPGARDWVRINTVDPPASDATGGAREPSEKPRVEFAPGEWEFGARRSPLNVRNLHLDFGDLRLEPGVKLRGRVVDAEGTGLAGVYLYTSGKRGPYDGRTAVTGEDGEFEFLPIEPGSFTIRVDARLRDEGGKVSSRNVQAVFLPQAVTLPDGAGPTEIEIQAVPHLTLEFEWIDRRAEKGPVAYYGTFPVSGQVAMADGSMAAWRGETERVTREGREILLVKVPRSLERAVLTLPADSVVTASYEDAQQTSGPGTVMLGDFSQPQRRIVYGDEPKSP